MPLLSFVVSKSFLFKVVLIKKFFNNYRLGFSNVQTYIQSGNVIFNSAETNVAKMVSKIQNKTKKSFGFDVTVIIRTTDEFKRVIEKTPFPNKDTSKLYVVYLADLPTVEPKEELNKLKNKDEEYFIRGKEVYFFCPNGHGKTKLSNNLFEKKLGVSATTRNCRTVNKLFDIASEINK